jgi:hypothetical protein
MKRERLLVDGQILQGKSRKRGFGNYAYRILNDLLASKDFEIEVLLNSSGSLRNTREIMEFTREKSLKTHVFDAPILITHEYSQKRISRAQKKYADVIDQICPDYLFVLTPMAILHEQILNLDFKNSKIKKIGIYYDRISIDRINAKEVLSLSDLDLIRKFNELPKFDLLFAISAQGKNEINSVYPATKVITHRLRIEQCQNYLNGDQMLSVVNSGNHKKLKELVKNYEDYVFSSPIKRPMTVIGVSPLKLLGQVKLNFTEGMKFYSSVSVKKMSALYAESLFVIVPSLKEGLGLPVIEALERGCIPLYSPTIPAAEILNNELFEFNPDTPFSLTNALGRVEALLATNSLEVNQSLQKAISEYNKKVVGISARIREFAFE